MTLHVLTADAWQRGRRALPLLGAGLMVAVTRHAPFAQDLPRGPLDIWVLGGLMAATMTMLWRPALSERARACWYSASVAGIAALVAATGGAASPFAIFYDVAAVLAATSLAGPAFGTVVVLLAAACLLPFLYTRPLGHDFPVMMTVAVPALFGMSTATRALFKREQSAARLARERAIMLEESFNATLLALGSALDVRDTETEEHARRVAHNSRLIAERLGIDADEVRRIERGAFLHDVGKIGVPDSVLRKPGPLDDAEWQLMRRHAAVGAQIVSRVPFLRPAAALIVAHHERWDGKGYPAGLSGEAIPLGARIFAVADAYDAMTSDRPYRRGLPHEVALAEIHRNGGTQFDPRVVAAFAELAHTGRLLAVAAGHADRTTPSPAPKPLAA